MAFNDYDWKILFGANCLDFPDVDWRTPIYIFHDLAKQLQAFVNHFVLLFSYKYEYENKK